MWAVKAWVPGLLPLSSTCNPCVGWHFSHTWQIQLNKRRGLLWLCLRGFQSMVPGPCSFGPKAAPHITTEVCSLPSKQEAEREEKVGTRGRAPSQHPLPGPAPITWLPPTKSQSLPYIQIVPQPKDQTFNTRASAGHLRLKLLHLTRSHFN